MDIFPDRGMARLRLYGQLTDRARAKIIDRWGHGEQAEPRA